MKNNTIFISYSQRDKERVSLFASLLTKNGFDIWMDVKNIAIGEGIVSAIANALNDVDIYMLFISNNSIESSWVTEELNIALAKNIKSKKPRIIPVLLDDCEIPAALIGRLCLDARNSIQAALLQLNRELQNTYPDIKNVIQTPAVPVLTGVTFTLSKKTNISIGPLCDGFTQEDLVNEREKIKKLLRQRANGILMNFVPPSDFDLQSPLPKYKNGVYDESIERIPGPFESSICEKIIATATVLNPAPQKINDLVKKKLDKLYVTSLTYTFSLPVEKGIDKRFLNRIQNNYSIISYDYENGTTIEYESNFFLSIKCNLEQIHIKLQSEYDSLFSKNAIHFSPSKFIDWLLEI